MWKQSRRGRECLIDYERSEVIYLATRDHKFTRNFYELCELAKIVWETILEISIQLRIDVSHIDIDNVLNYFYDTSQTNNRKITVKLRPIILVTLLVFVPNAIGQELARRWHNYTLGVNEYLLGAPPAHDLVNYIPRGARDLYRSYLTQGKDPYESYILTMKAVLAVATKSR